MDHKQSLVTYIQAHVQDGISADIIKQQLIDHGWDAALVDEAILKATQSTTHNPDGTNILENIDKPVLSEIYGVRQAFAEAIAAIKNNISVIAILTAIGMIIPAIVYTGVILASSELVANVPQNQYYAPGTRGEDFLFTRVMPLLILAGVVIGVFSVFTQIATSSAVNDGVEKRKTNIKTAALVALKRTPRLLLVGLIFSLFVSSPLLIIGVIGLIVAALTQGIAPMLLPLIPIGVGLSLYLTFRYALLPIVAIFEPALSIKQLFNRTKHLMSIGGSLFYFKLAVAGFVISFLLSFLSSLVGDAFSAVGMITDIAVMIVFPVVSTAIGVVFYRNRLLARG